MSVWYAASQATAAVGIPSEASECFHTDPDCFHLQTATQVARADREDVADRLDVCRYCAGDSINDHDQDHSRYQALKNTSAEEVL